MNTAVDKQVQDAALAWIARLRADSASDADRLGFALWLAEDDTHATAFDDALALWEELGAALSVQPVAANSAGPRRWLPAAAALAACLALAIFLWPLSRQAPESVLYQSALGERRDIELPDGSHAVLNTDTAIRVEYTQGERHILLKRGEAWFKVQSNKQRPFHVDAGGARVTALGTAFNVYRDGDDTEVTVTEGVVRVSELGETGSRAPSAEILHARQQLAARPAGWQVAMAQDIEQQLAWREGRLVARGMPLPELIRQLRRYSPTAYLLADPELATLTVSGVFDLDRPESILRALELSLGLEARVVDDHTVQLLKADR